MKKTEETALTVNHYTFPVKLIIKNYLIRKIKFGQIY
jgi:hypothetical protein